MAKKIEKGIPWILVAIISIMIVCGAGMVLKEAIAASITPSVTVGNSAPSVGTVILNSNAAITVVENTSTLISGTTTITDDNGYGDITSVTSTLFLNNTSTACGSVAASNPNWCYYISNGTANGTCVTSSCTGLNCVVTCSAYVWFLAEPTTPTTSYSGKQWQMSITAKDAYGSTSVSGTTGQALNTLYSFDLGSTIAYGTVAVGATSNQQTVNATNTGNFAIDFQMSGVNMTSTANTIAVGQQHYSSTTGFQYASGITLTTSAVSFNVDMQKSTATSTPTGELVYWMIQIPTSTTYGTYTGTNTTVARDAM